MCFGIYPKILEIYCRVEVCKDLKEQSDISKMISEYFIVEMI